MMVKYWDNLEDQFKKEVFVGRWGDKTRGGGFMPYWTDITKKDNYTKINLAIVRLKDEYDFIDNEIIKYIETIKALNLLEEALYFKIKYGTDNKEKIALLNCGISNTLSNLLYKIYGLF